jgi:hypothetical protein
MDAKALWYDTDNGESNLRQAYSEGVDKTFTNEYSLDWYKDAFYFCANLSRQYHISVVKVVAALAALSPQTSWDTNKQELETLLDDLSRDDLKKTYHLYQATSDKAVTCLTDDKFAYDWYKVGKNKTWCFMHNILGDSSKVTIDRHMVSCWLGVTWYDPKKHGSLTDKRYLVIQDSIIKLANELGVTPSDYQATVWITRAKGYY